MVSSSFSGSGQHTMRSMGEVEVFFAFMLP